MTARSGAPARRPKLVMTLLVRDEIDIIERNLKHHLDSGVDFIVATDNGSVDGTREVLLRYQERGRLHLIDEPAQDMDQARWVNRMGRLAYEEFGAEAVFHCDADEFWYALSGDLTAEISRGPEPAYTAHSFNVHLADRGGRETIDDAVWVAFEALGQNVDPADPAVRISYKRKRRLRPSLGKVMTSTRHGYLEVAIGNHILASGERPRWSRDVYLLHYPVRSFAQFTQKVANGGAAIERNPNIAPRDALHWREWYAHYLAGTLETDYGALLIRDPEWYVRQGVMCDRRGLTDEEFAAAVRDAIKRRLRRPPLATRVRKFARISRPGPPAPSPPPPR